MLILFMFFTRQYDFVVVFFDKSLSCFFIKINFFVFSIWFKAIFIIFWCFLCMNNLELRITSKKAIFMLILTFEKGTSFEYFIWIFFMKKTNRKQTCNVLGQKKYCRNKTFKSIRVFFWDFWDFFLTLERSIKWGFKKNNL